jgi:hypothetical protein
MKKTLIIGLSLAATVAVQGCTPVRLKAPEAVKSSQELKVEGYSQGKFAMKAKDFAIGSYKVTDINHDWQKGSGASFGGYSASKKKNAYRFDVSAQGRTVHAECSAVAAEQGVAAVGFGKSNVTVSCACNEGDTPRATFEHKNGLGQATVAGVTYDMSELYTAESGSQSSKALGYNFRSAKGTGAVDITGTGRAWMPTTGGEDEQLGLVCSYAAFLLYRPAS